MDSIVWAGVGFLVANLLMIPVLRLERRGRLRAFEEGRDATNSAALSLKLQIDDLSREVEAARERAGAAEAKTKRYLDLITTFEHQRDEWQGKWQTESIAHGNAQELMMSTISRLHQQLQLLSKEHPEIVRVPKIPAILNEVRAEYEQVHEAPARAAAPPTKLTKEQIQAIT